MAQALAPRWVEVEPLQAKAKEREEVALERNERR
jgi:hypothetical protein